VEAARAAEALHADLSSQLEAKEAKLAEVTAALQTALEANRVSAEKLATAQAEVEQLREASTRHIEE
jgi:exonuclease VII small subunit